jgi:hypothetical protein
MTRKVKYRRGLVTSSVVSVYSPQNRRIGIPPSPPSSQPNWILRIIEHNKIEIFGEIRAVLSETGLQRIGFPVIRFKESEFSPGCDPAVRYYRKFAP